ncbi:MAG: hypothetical protein ACI3YT_01565 [Prevotella sp.]
MVKWFSFHSFVESNTGLTDMFKIFPDIVNTVFAQNSVAVVFLCAVVLNLVLPKDKKDDALAS